MPKGTRRTATGDGEQFARPLYDTIKDLEKEYEVNITIEMRPSGRRGEFEVVLAAYRQDAELGARPCCLVSKDWPHATVQSVPALMYNLAFKLGRLVEEGLTARIDESVIWETAQARRRKG